MKNLPSSLLFLSILLVQHGSPSPLMADEEPGGPHCHILRPGADRYEDVLKDDKGNPIDTKEKCKEFRKAKGWKGFFKDHWLHCNIGGKDAKAVGDKYQCAAAGGKMDDRTHVVRP